MGGTVADQGADTQLMAWALDYLRRFDVTRQRLRQHLLKKATRSAALRSRWGHVEPDPELDEDAAPHELRERVDAVLGELERRRLLDDRRHAEARLTSLQARGLAPAVARARLRQQGVSASVIAGAEASVHDDAGETPREAALSAAWAAARRRGFGPFRADAQRGDERDRDLAKLLRAGHAFEHVRAVIDAPTVDGVH